MGVVKRIIAALLMILWIGFSIQLEAAPMLTAPADLAPGAHFRFIFLTSGKTQATSTNIADYNTFVQAQASGATYAGVTVNWKAVGSTTSVSARDNVGGFNTTVPVYLVTGTRVANSLGTLSGGLWYGAILAKVNTGIDGSTITSTPPYSWTGSLPSGTSASPSSYLGSSLPVFGGFSFTTPYWIQTSVNRNTNNYGMYAVSEELVTPQAPSATTIAATSITTTSATLNGTVNDNGASTTVTFNYGQTDSYGSTATASQSPISMGTGSTAVSAALTGLTCNTTYHYQVSATNSVGTTNGSDASFTTSACTVPTLSISPSSVAYNGSAQTTTVTCTSGGAVSNILYNGSITAPTAAGTYPITANCAATSSSSALSGVSAGSFQITAITPALTVTNSPQTFTGSAIPAILSCTGGGTVSNVLYSGSSTVPTAAGTYAITADCAASSNYSAVTGASAGNFVINQGIPTLSVTNSPQTYTGLAIPAVVSCLGGGAVSNVLYGGSSSVPSAVGTYAITANCAASSNYSAVTGASGGNFLISSAPAPTVSSVSPSTGTTAGGTAIAITGTGFLSGATATVGAITCSSPIVVSSTSITCSTGARAAGAVDVVVTNPDTQTGTGANVYTYQSNDSSGTTPGGNVAAAISGGTFVAGTAQFTTPTNPPSGQSFPYGMFGFTASTTSGGTITITLTYPQALAAGTKVWKDLNGTWLDWTNNVTISGNTITYTITDGGAGDADGSVNGSITDPLGPATPSTPVPTLSEWSQMLLGLMVLSLIGWHFQKQRSY